MSLNSICQEAAAEVGVAPPTGIIGNSETTAVRLLAAAKREIFAMAHSAAWTALVKEHGFTTVTASAQTGGLPNDFAYVIDGTAWDRTNRRPLDGPLSAPQWQTLQAKGTGTPTHRAFRIFGSNLHLYPTPPTVGDLIAFEYVSNEIVQPTSGAMRTTWQADDDTFVLSEELAAMGVKWRFKKAIGMPYDDDLNEYLSVLARAIARDGGRPVLRVDGPGSALHRPDIPDGNFPES